MLRLKTTLENSLKHATKIAVLGIGSELRSDDGVGVVIAKRLKAHIKKSKINSIKVFLGETAPENLTGEIKKFKPSHLLIIDAIDFQKEAGAVGIIDTSEERGASFSTHRLPIGIIKDYLFKSIACQTVIIGIQPRSLDFCIGLSDSIQESAKIVLEDILELLKNRIPNLID